MNKKNAFTLLELLVVVSIIALLVSILVPALANARAQARTTLCTSRHREIYMAWMFYAEDHDGRIMPSWHGWSTEDVHGGWWVWLIPPYIANLTWRSDWSLPDALWPKTMFCPERNGPIAKLDTGGPPLATGGWIGMNALLVGGWGRPVAEAPPRPRLGSLVSPASLVVYTDSRADTYFWNPPAYNYTSFAYRHANHTSSNFALADGHVELTRTRARMDYYPADGTDDAFPPKQYAYRPLESKLGHPRGNYDIYNE